MTKPNESDTIARIIDQAKTAFRHESKGQLTDYWNAIEIANGQYIDFNICLKSDEDDKDEVHAVTAYAVVDNSTVIDKYVQVATFVNGKLGKRERI